MLHLSERRQWETEEMMKKERKGGREEGSEESVKGIGRVREGKGKKFIVCNQIDGWIYVLS